ncbi:MAG: DUF1893 domain-containing protein [Oscillospiraceae bacterium]|nr:DUF1893 domain-containing protein [Oscillospiraceae bacterium]
MEHRHPHPDLETAKHALASQAYTCVLCKGETVHTATHRGVKPLLDWLDSGIDLRGFRAADKVVGRATAFLYVLLGVEAVYAQVMSRPAAEILHAHHIEATWGTLVDGIINRAGTGPCPFEAAVLDIREPNQALQAIRQKRREMIEKG